MESITNGYAWYIKGSHFHSGEDDFWTGGECQTRAQAEEEAAEYLKRNKEGHVWVILASFEQCDYTPRTLVSGVVYDAIIEGENVLSETSFGEDMPDTADDWRREQAMQAGMAFGCQGYNDAMGY